MLHRVEPSPAVLIRVRDPELQAYLQQYSFATGPDRDRNRRAFEAVRASIEVRRPSEAADVWRLPAAAGTLTPAELARVHALAAGVGITRQQLADATADYGWKMREVPRTARKVFVIGCGAGPELLFLRTILPDATIVAFDWRDQLFAGIARATDVEFRAGNFMEGLAAPGERADVIFSNHVLEHMFAPEATLAVLLGRLQAGGVLVSALPMEAMPEGPFTRAMLALAAHPERLHALDLFWINAGHAWQTNPSDLRATVLGAGFSTCRLVQREDFVSRFFPGPRADFERHRDRAQRAFELTFGAAERAAKAVRVKPSWLALRLWFGLQARSRVGATKLRHDFAEEILLVAERP